MDNIEKGKNKREILVKGVPVELRNHFKSYCAKRSISMTKMIIGFMKKCVMEDLK